MWVIITFRALYSMVLTAYLFKNSSLNFTIIIHIIQTCLFVLLIQPGLNVLVVVVVRCAIKSKAIFAI